MKKFISILFFGLATVLLSSARDGYGFLNFANVIPGETPCEILVNSTNPAKQGLKSSTHTGWFLFPAGSCSFSVKAEGFEEIKGEMTIEEGIGSLIVIFTEKDPAAETGAKPVPRVLRTKSFPTYQSKGREMRFVSLCEAEHRFQLGALSLEVERFRITPIPSWTGAGFELKKNGQSIGKISTTREKEPFYLFAGSDVEGNYAAVLVFAGKPGVPAWRKKKRAGE